MGNRVGEGPGETRPETGPAREDRGTPGARRANAGSGASREDRESSDDPASGFAIRSRRALRASTPLPEGYDATVLGRPGRRRRRQPRRRSSSAAIADHVRLLLAWNERHQPERDPRAGGDRPRARPGQPDGPAAAAPGRRRRVRGPRQRRRLPRPAAGRRPAGDAGPPRGVGRRRRPASWPRPWRPLGLAIAWPWRRPGPRPWPPTRATAAAGRPSWRGRWRTCTELAELSLPLLRPGRTARGLEATGPSTTSWRGRSERCASWAAASPAASAWPCRASRTTSWWSSRRWR